MGDVGQEDLLNIVCGAPNVAAGQRVVVATIGTTVYKGDDSLLLKNLNPWCWSEGLASDLCPEDETGMGDGHEDIMVLDVWTMPRLCTPAHTYSSGEPETLFVIELHTQQD